NRQVAQALFLSPRTVEANLARIYRKLGISSRAEGLTEAQEAEVFLKLNDTLPVRAFAKFKVSVQAGRDAEADVDRIVRALGLRIARGSGGGAPGGPPRRR